MTTHPTPVALRSPGLPPGPRAPMAVQTLLGVLFTERYTRYCRRRFGPVVTLHIVGLGRFVSVSDPAVIREVFTGDPDVLRAGDSNAILGSLGPTSVLVADGERHLRLRRLLSPPLHGQAVRRQEEVVRAIAEQEVDRWPAGRPFPALPRMQAIGLEVILRAVIGVRDRERAARLRAVLPRILGAGLATLLVENRYPRPFASRLARRLPWLRAREEAFALIDEEIAAHRSDPGGRDDVLALLLAARGDEGRPLGDEELRDQIVTLLMAGHETTATALAWALERLVRHPAALARLRREIADGGGDAYLEAVIHETLRVRPVLDQVGRRLAEPMPIGGHLLPAGTIVSPSILGVQLSEAVFDDPEAFRPERFLDRAPPPHTLIPFGGGTRRCAGASFAVMEMKTVLRVILERVVLEPSRERPERASRARRFTTVPARGGRVTVSRTASPS